MTKGLKELELLRIFFDKTDPPVREAFWIFREENKNLPLLEMNGLFKLYGSFITKYSPIGHALRMGNKNRSILNLAISHPDPIILGMVLDMMFGGKNNGDLGSNKFDINPEVLFKSSPAHMKLLIQHGIDLSTPQRIDVSTATQFDGIIRNCPTVEMFQSLFETKLAQNGTMTAFDYARMLHPEIRFFCVCPVFSRIMSVSSNDPPFPDAVRTVGSPLFGLVMQFIEIYRLFFIIHLK